MNEVSNTESVRALSATNSSRKDAAAASHTATQGQGSGKELPEQKVTQHSKTERQAVENNRAAQQKAESAVRVLNEYAQSFQRDIEFSVDQELGRPIVHVVDRHTQEVVRQIPNDVALRLARNLQHQQEVQLQAASESRVEQFGASSVHSLGLVNTEA